MDEKAINDTNLGIIAQQMKGNDLDIRIQAARALGYIGPLAKSTIPALIDALHADEPQMVAQVSWSLGRMGDAAERAIPSLEEVARSNKDRSVQATAKEAIDEIKKKKK